MSKSDHIIPNTDRPLLAIFAVCKWGGIKRLDILSGCTVHITKD